VEEWILVARREAAGGTSKDPGIGACALGMKNIANTPRSL